MQHLDSFHYADFNELRRLAGKPVKNRTAYPLAANASSGRWRLFLFEWTPVCALPHNALEILAAFSGDGV
jgi:hypothetical protein